ncbi:MAG: ribosome biogenesis factor YjgA [Desulfuromonadales bacterium]
MTEGWEVKPSRTARKREAQAVEELARKLVDLPEATGKKLPLTPEIHAKLQLARATKGHSARDRQIRHLAAVLREEEDLSPLVEFLAGQDRRAWEERQHFHRLEAWRDRLCHPAEFSAALAEIRTALPKIDADRLTRLAGAVHAYNDRRAAREIFRLLRETKP